MRLTKDQYTAVGEEVQKLVSGRCCGICGGKSFSLPDTVFQLNEFEPGQEAAAVAPVVVLTCNQCGFIRFFSATFIQSRLIDGVVGGEGLFNPNTF